MQLSVKKIEGKHDVQSRLVRKEMPCLYQGQGGESVRPIPVTHRDGRHLRRLPLGTGETEEVRGQAERAVAPITGANSVVLEKALQ